MKFIQKRYKTIAILSMVMFIAICAASIVLKSTIFVPILSGLIVVGLIYGIQAHKTTLIQLMHRNLAICLSHETATAKPIQRVTDSEVVIATFFIEKYFWATNDVGFEVPPNGGLFIKTKNNMFKLIETSKEDVNRIIESDCA